MNNEHLKDKKSINAVKWYNKGITYEQSGKLVRAAESYRQAIKYNLDFVEAYTNLGNALDGLGKIDAALEAHNTANRLRPNNALILANLGKILTSLERYSQAEVALNNAIKLEPDSILALVNIGNLALQQKNTDSAIRSFEKALSIFPENIGISVNLALAMKQAGRFKDAKVLLTELLQRQPNDTHLLSNLASVLQLQGEYNQALELLQKAVMLAPANAELHWNLGLVLLTIGDFKQGWQEYEWRSSIQNSDLSKRKFKSPKWDGQPLGNSKVLFLYSEQGCGDAIQFIRYVSLIEKNGGRIIVQCQPALKRLFQSIKIIDLVITDKDKIPAFDFHVPIMSLPGIFDTSIDTIPTDIPYFDIDQFSGIATPDTEKKLKVGIVWAGNPAQQVDCWRSMKVEDIEPLFTIEGVQFYNLQVGERANEIKSNPFYKNIIDLSDQLIDYAATAKVIAELDLVISVCTSVAHLAGAIGTPVWIPLAKAADFRWLTDTNRSPWYPTVHLFRQSEMGNWSDPVVEIREKLQARVDSG